MKIKYYQNLTKYVNVLFSTDNTNKIYLVDMGILKIIDCIYAHLISTGANEGVSVWWWWRVYKKL